MKRVLVLYALAVLGFIISCTEELNNENKEEQYKAKEEVSTTIGAEKETAVSAVLKGRANLGSSVAFDMIVGFQVSKSAGIIPSNATIVEAEEVSAEYYYLSAINELSPATTYYFRSFIRQNGLDTYGETLSFTTKEITSLIETGGTTDIEAESAIINAKLDLTDVKYKTIDYGFYWGTTGSERTYKTKGDITESNTLSACLTNLAHKTKYWFQSYVILDDIEYRGDIKQFSTGVIPADRITLNNTNLLLTTIGDVAYIKATVYPEEATEKGLIWSSSNEEIAVVNQNGRITAIDNGSATITVKTINQEITATCNVIVAQHVTEIKLDKSYVVMEEGETTSLIATVNPNNANDKTITWVSSDESVAIVDNNGKITAISKGVSTITAKAIDGSKQESSCSIVVNRPVKAITLAESSIFLYTGGEAVILATIRPSGASNQEIIWESMDPSIAKVSETGVVSGIRAGETSIIATSSYDSSIQAMCLVEVRQSISKIELDKQYVVLVEGNSYTLSATISPDNAYDNSVIWQSGNESVATVDDNGCVTAVSKGYTDISAASKMGPFIRTFCNIKVCPYPEAIDLGLSVKWASFNIGAYAPGQNGFPYAWGETDSKDIFQLDTYKWVILNTPPKKSIFTKYTTTTVLETGPEGDDVASKVLGGEWRMPTQEEWIELIDNCTLEWLQYNQGYNAAGMLVTGKNGNSVFLPATNGASSNGYYWSSTLKDDQSGWEKLAWAFLIKKLTIEQFEAFRYQGLYVRPVCP